MPLAEKEIPPGLCQCGCGESTPVAKRTYGGKGIVAGRPVRYLTGHHRRKRDHYEVRDCGYETPCWVWTLSGNGHGYGRMRDWSTGRPVPAHRWYYERERGPIPEGLQLDHLCCNKGCVNPDHLEPVTAAENALRHHRPHLFNELKGKGSAEDAIRVARAEVRDAESQAQ